MEDRIKYLESLIPKNDNDIEEKYIDNFEKHTSYIGSGVYTWLGFYSSDTRELFLMGLLHKENIEFKRI